MASARELLEQADALMRRNRSPLMDDIPVLTDSVPVTPAGRPAARLRPAPAAAPDTIPILTETVESEPASSAPAAPAVVEEGEPSDWLQTGGAEPSVIGEAPDSIAMVPYFTDTREEIELEAPPEVEESFDAELAERAHAPAPSDEPEHPPHEPEHPSHEPEHPSHESEPSYREAELASPEPELASPEPELASPEPEFPSKDPELLSYEVVAHEPPTEAHPLAGLADDQPLAPPELLPGWESNTIIDEPQEEEAAPEAAAHPLHAEPRAEAAALDAPAPDEAIDDAASPPLETAAPPVPVVQAGPSAEERRAAETARWASMAEEIRMQVLQRIDLFTDTGLRDQLGARLQPIVDRASADLVRTINQHVGELLRSYVAEAIEREIENWKRNTENL